MASEVPAVFGVHPTHGILLLARRNCILLAQGQSDGLDLPAWEESSAESHTGLVCCFGIFLTSV